VIKSIAAVKNCFTGEFESDLCDNFNYYMNAPSLAPSDTSLSYLHGTPSSSSSSSGKRHVSISLHVLALDGLHSSPNCIEYYWNPFQFFTGTPGYTTNVMQGTIPDCFWLLPNLTTLHLAGNGFNGLISSFAAEQYSPKLKDVSLSHNELFGTLPPGLQQLPMTNFDLSYNKIYGDLNSISKMPFSYESNTSSTGAVLTLENNRLSGKTAKVIENAYNIDVLYGNLFACSNHLPREDPSYEDYICGSTELDSAAEAFSIYLLIMVMYYRLYIFERNICFKTKVISFRKYMLQSPLR
jgi:hypothetical protein